MTPTDLFIQEAQQAAADAAMLDEYLSKLEPLTIVELGMTDAAFGFKRNPVYAGNAEYNAAYDEFLQRSDCDEF